MANEIKFTVGGIRYAITSEDSEEYIHSIALELERKMDRLAKQNPFLSTTMVAVLAAMDTADALKRVEAENNTLRDELKEMTERCAVAHSDAEQAKRRLEMLRNRHDN